MWQECLPSLCFFAKASIEAVGSEPIDKKQIIGVRTSLSSHMASRFRITPSAYCKKRKTQEKSHVTQLLQFSSAVSKTSLEIAVSKTRSILGRYAIVSHEICTGSTEVICDSKRSEKFTAHCMSRLRGTQRKFLLNTLKTRFRLSKVLLDL